MFKLEPSYGQGSHFCVFIHVHIPQENGKQGLEEASK